MLFRDLSEEVTPQPANEEYYCCEDHMNNEGSKLEFVQLSKINVGEPEVLKEAEGRVVNNHKCGNGKLKFPVLVSDQYGTANKGKEVHFKHAVHLVNELCHKNSQYTAQYILIQV